ncbi:hypothetical protein ACMXYX_05585 [Neptuniibacter sp. QD72_48]|uniref:hypothetical protein n=1 Tax=unclassified Neptuniibacter TaxID=2630693 RepID=UPI0039F556B0
MSNPTTLDSKDIPFFLPLGAAISTAMWLLDKVDLPDQMNRGFLTSLFSDHIPFGTIGALFLAIAMLELLSVSVSKEVGFLSKQNRHLSRRLSQLASPAFFITFGFTLPIFIIYLCTGERAYGSYCSVFAIFSLLLWGMSFLARQLVLSSRAMHTKLPRVIAVGILLAVGVGIIWNAISDLRPKKIEVKFEYGLYTAIKNSAQSENITVEEFLRRATLKRVNDGR